MPSRMLYQNFTCRVSANIIEELRPEEKRIKA